MNVIIDADDFHEGNTSWEIMERIHKKNGMLFNLFTVVGKCSPHWIQEMKKVPWIDMIPHGWLHHTSHECEAWDMTDAILYLERIEPLKLTRGFKAPGWRSSQDLYVALHSYGYWIADHPDNDLIRPSGMNVFCIPPECHFHIGGKMNNRIDNHVDRLMAMTGPFGFIKDLFRK